MKSLSFALFAILILYPCQCLEQYHNFGLTVHNNLRARHNAPPLQMDLTLSKIAYFCAKYYSEINRIDHSCPWKSIHGENLAMFGHSNGAPNKLASMSNSMNGWYNEHFDYDYWQPQRSLNKVVFHFTQLVWKDSRFLGVGAYRNVNTRRTFVVALYEPKGNIMNFGYDTFNWFRGNVTPPVSFNSL